MILRLRFGIVDTAVASVAALEPPSEFSPCAGGGAGGEVGGRFGEDISMFRAVVVRVCHTAAKGAMVGGRQDVRA
eukprot:2278869-Rhodomonas_salina.1